MPYQGVAGLSHLAAMLEIPVTGGEHVDDLAAFKTLLHTHALVSASVDLTYDRYRVG